MLLVDFRNMTHIQQELDWGQQITEESASDSEIQEKEKQLYKNLAEVFQHFKSKLVSMKIHPNSTYGTAYFNCLMQKLFILNFYLTLSCEKNWSAIQHLNSACFRVTKHALFRKKKKPHQRILCGVLKVCLVCFTGWDSQQKVSVTIHCFQTSGDVIAKPCGKKIMF